MARTIEETIIYCKEMAAGLTDCNGQDTYRNVARWLEELQTRRGVGFHRETFRERLAEEFPKAIDPRYFGGADGCPVHFGYEKQRPDFCQGGNEEICTKCWNREVPVVETHGHWIDYMGGVMCSVCGFTCDDEYYLGAKRACPNCTSIMDEKEDAT